MMLMNGGITMGTMMGDDDDGEWKRNQRTVNETTRHPEDV